MSEFKKALTKHREAIDAIDDDIIALLLKRCEIVQEVGKLKREHMPDQNFIRSGREADMIRRIYKAFSDTPFSAEAAVSIWRLIIAASTHIENELSLSVLQTDEESHYAWLGREYFGNFLPVSTQRMASHVVADVADGKASIGILPLPSMADEESWWPHLISDRERSPKIFAQIPMLAHKSSGKSLTPALAIAMLEPEESSDDVSYLALEVDDSISTSRLQTLFTQAKLKGGWISVLTHPSGLRQLLVNIEGFVSEDDARLEKLRESLGESVQRMAYLGSHGVPIQLPVEKETHVSSDLGSPGGRLTRSQA